MFLKKYKTQLLIGLAVLCVIYLVVNREHFTIENLTGNAPKELPLPSELNPADDKGYIGTYDKRFLDKCDEVPPGLDAKAKKRFLERCDITTKSDSKEADYLLSPGTVQDMMDKQNTAGEYKTDQEEMKEKIDDLEKQIADLKKQLNK